MRLGILKDDSESYLFVQIKLIWLYLNTNMCFRVCFSLDIIICVGVSRNAAEL